MLEYPRAQDDRHFITSSHRLPSGNDYHTFCFTHLAPALAWPDWHMWKRTSFKAAGKAFDSAVDAMLNAVFVC